ncbi:MAG: hypothetical protein E7160_00730 [Firmicutes bacterium]|nr:hypothetical protein [Bacillota bacterium]
MKKKNLNNIIILILSITTILVGISFIYVSMRLTALEKNKPKYEVKILNVEEGTIINGTKKVINNDYNITDNNKTVELNFKLNDQKDSISYKVVIKNTGTLPAQIDNIIERTNYSKSYLNIEYNDILGEVINPNEEINLEISISAPKKEILTKDFTYKLSILTSNIE